MKTLFFTIQEQTILVNYIHSVNCRRTLDVMSETNNEFLAALESAADQIKVGDVVIGELLAIDNDNQAVVVLPTGEEGVVPAREYSDDRNINLADELKIGDSIEAVVISNVTSDKEGVAYLLSKKRLDARKAWENLSFGEGDTVDAKVINAVRGGLIVDVNGVRGFVPASMVAERFVSDLNQFRNKDIKAQVIEIDPANARLILSRKAVAAQERAAQLAEIFSKLSVGEVVEGTVARLTDFGAFVEILPGIEGLVHVSQISNKRIENPSEVLKSGDKVQVKVLDIKPAEERISLSMKALEEKPQREDRRGNDGAASRADIAAYKQHGDDSGATLGDIFGDKL